MARGKEKREGYYSDLVYLAGSWSMVCHLAMASSSVIPPATASRRQALTAWIYFIFSPVRL